MWETRLKLRILGLSKPKEVAKLSEDAAADLGAEMLGELLMFCFGAAILFYEYRRQARKEANKEDNIQKTFDELTNQINELSTLIQIHEARLREHTRLMAKITSDEHCE
ncbi:optic atrophy 3 protein homolog [Clonorchis sinensis]|uniref:Optic atrophy 3 protein homolog n=1 Tax=Clonorchis sinensis TaxID=79923 RepID=G7YAT8_CLOSI|nr:optic atrophy 3 protein homolog [Clonorchis sinensis]